MIYFAISYTINCKYMEKHQKSDSSDITDSYQSWQWCHIWNFISKSLSLDGTYYSEFIVVSVPSRLL